MNRPVPSHHGQGTVDGDAAQVRDHLAGATAGRARRRLGGLCGGLVGCHGAARVADVDRSSSRPSPLLGSHFWADRGSMAPARKDESGWTLPEMMLGLLLSLGIAASSLAMLETTLRSQSETGSRLAAQDDGSTAMLRLTKDIRTATGATVQSSTILDLQVPQRDPPGAPRSARTCATPAAACRRRARARSAARRSTRAPAARRATS